MKRHERPGAPMKAPRVSFVTFGCRLNQHDTAAMRAALCGAGWAEADGPDGDAPDVVVVNTCTVTARADQEARQRIRSLAASRPGARVVVTGCYAQRAPAEVARIPGVSLVLGTREREAIAAALAPLASRAPGPDPAVQVGLARNGRVLAPVAPLSFGRTRALLKVQDGCDSFCSYCIVPYVRGRSRSLPIEAALEQARRLLDAGFHELVVTGADLGAYGKDLGAPGRCLATLVERLLALGSGHRVRLSSIEPHKVDPSLAGLVGREPRLCRHLHLPLQSGSAAILRAMRRPYTPADYAALLERLLARGPVGFGADVIVGHPGEGDAEHEETVRFVTSLPLAYLHVFRYSPRPGTSAAAREAPPAAVARARSEQLRRLGDAKRLAFFATLVGSTLPALVEGGGAPGAVPARTDVHAPVLLRERPAAPGIVPVRVEALEDGALRGAVPGSGG